MALLAVDSRLHGRSLHMIVERLLREYSMLDL